MARSSRAPKVEKTAISIPKDVLEHAHRMVREGVAPSLSGYFAGLARRDRDRRELGQFIQDLEHELGMTDAERTRIDAKLGLGRRRRNAG